MTSAALHLQAALRQAVQALRNAEVGEARLDAELLLAYTLGLNRAAILAQPDRPLTPKELTRFRDLVARRAAREPLPYITGHREFFGLDFAVDARVLIPRPETELLVEHALRIARPVPGSLPPALEIADVGAGSGAIAVALAVHLPRATVYALDDSAGALALTAENARRHNVAGRVRCRQGDLLAPLPGPVSLVTANLPYVAAGEWADLPPEIRDHEPRAALDGGPDGLDAISRLLATTGPYLHPGGALLLEIGASQGAAVTALARRYFPAADLQLHRDYAGLDRLVIVQLSG
ncbi:MAG: peptide chain release factor N(5)-glutamine methyltransferase [Anaerolineae bacterium]|nr:peptide chain release factor N(5)-glutamine methyltransferase [Anaerolineae bacterium]